MSWTGHDNARTVAYEMLHQFAGGEPFEPMATKGQSVWPRKRGERAPAEFMRVFAEHLHHCLLFNAGAGMVDLMPDGARRWHDLLFIRLGWRHLRVCGAFFWIFCE